MVSCPTYVLSRVPAPLSGAGTRDEPLRTSVWKTKVVEFLEISEVSTPIS